MLNNFLNHIQPLAMPVVENPDAVHGAWQSAVDTTAAANRPRAEGTEPEEDDESHPWFKTGHERRQARTL